MSRNVTSNAFALLASSILLMASFGCNPGAITGPETSSDVTIVENPDFVRILSTSSKGAEYAAMAVPVSAVISAAEGGVISNGRVTLTFPAGALDQDTEISIQMLGNGTLGVNLEPHGTQFNVPVILTMDLTGTSAEGKGASVNTVYDNEDTGQYELMNQAPGQDANTSAAYLGHFSRYGNING